MRALGTSNHVWRGRAFFDRFGVAEFVCSVIVYVCFCSMLTFGGLFLGVCINIVCLEVLGGEYEKDRLDGCQAGLENKNMA
jgi:hypothetical protein